MTPTFSRHDDRDCKGLVSQVRQDAQGSLRMTDIVERLRNRDEWGWLPWWDEAAEEFEQVRAQANAEIIKLNDALWEKQQEIERLRAELELVSK